MFIAHQATPNVDPPRNMTRKSIPFHLAKVDHNDGAQNTIQVFIIYIYIRAPKNDSAIIQLISIIFAETIDMIFVFNHRTFQLCV